MVTRLERLRNIAAACHGSLGEISLARDDFRFLVERAAAARRLEGRIDRDLDDLPPSVAVQAELLQELVDPAIDELLEARRAAAEAAPQPPADQPEPDPVPPPKAKPKRSRKR